MVSQQTRDAIVARAFNRCEYCRLRQEHYPLWLHQVEHIIPKKHFGSDGLGNLALACCRCNLGKSSNITGIDQTTGLVTRLFNPREDSWHEHFTYDLAHVVGTTLVGRVTVWY